MDDVVLGVVVVFLDPLCISDSDVVSSMANLLFVWIVGGLF